MMEESFARGVSLLHTFDPRAKILCALAFIVLISTSPHLEVVLLGLMGALTLVLMSRLSPIAIGKRLLVVNSFTLFLWFTLPLTYGGATFFSAGPLTLSYDGLQLAGLITLKTNTILLCFISLITTSPVVSIGHSLEKLGVSPRLCFILLFSYRYIFVILDEYQKLNRAAQIRNFTPGTNLRTYQTYGYLFGMTLIKSWNRSRRVHQAMVLRGFNGQLRSLHLLQTRKRDYLLVTTMTTFLALLITLSFSL